MAVAEKAKAKMPDRVVVETTPRHSSASNGSGQRMTRTTRKRLFRLKKLSCSRSWHQNIVDCHQERDSMKVTLRGTKGSVSQRRTPSTLLGQRMAQWEREQFEGWNRRHVQKFHCCSRYRECLGTWYQTHLHEPCHQSSRTRQMANQTVQATAHPRRHHQHKLRAEFRNT